MLSVPGELPGDREPETVTGAKIVPLPPSVPLWFTTTELAVIWPLTVSAASVVVGKYQSWTTTVLAVS